MQKLQRTRSDVITALVQAVLAYCRAHDTDIVSASLVGSRSPESRERASRADIDLLVLVHDLRVSGSFGRWLSDRMGDGVTIVTGWGVVDASESSSEMVHCLLDPLDHYVRYRSRLFRRAVAKYQPLIGRCLREFAPGPVSLPDLLTDWDGPVRLTHALVERRYETRAWQIYEGSWKLAVLPNDTASPLDHALYSALHSCRNVLRALRAYDEGTTVDELPAVWRRMHLPAAKALQSIADTKQSRRSGADARPSEAASAYATCVDFLHQVIHHVSRSA